MECFSGKFIKVVMNSNDVVQLWFIITFLQIVHVPIYVIQICVDLSAKCNNAKCNNFLKELLGLSIKIM